MPFLKSRVIKIFRTEGFTFIELTLVLSLLAFILYLAVPQSKFSKNIDVRTEVETMHMLITYLHYYALAIGQDQELIIDTKNHCYHYHGSTHSLAPGVQFGIRDEVHGPPSSPSQRLDAAVTFPRQKVVCTAHGSLSSGAVYFTDVNKECLYALSIPVGSCQLMRKYQYFNKKWTIVR